MNPILFLFGYYKISADPLSATRLLNLCLEYRFSFSHFEGEEDGSVSFCCPAMTARKLLSIAAEREISVKTERIGGLPALLFRRIRRYGLLLGAFCGALLIFFSGQFVWDIRITGNETMERREILEELQACGFGIGSPIKGFSAGELENRVLLQSDSLSWISVYLDGTVAKVQVLERVTPSEDTSKKPANLVATRDGQIESIELFRGDCMVKIGQAVRAGELLVSGIFESQTQGLRFTRAAGTVLARTERSYRVEIPLETTQKVYSAEKKSGIWLNFFQKSLKIFKSTGNVVGDCDIIIMENHFSGLGLQELPVWLTVETCRYYEEIPIRRTEEEALELAYEQLSTEMSELSEGSQLLRKEIVTIVTDRSVILDCVVLCVENIAEQSEFDVVLSP